MAFGAAQHLLGGRERAQQVFGLDDAVAERLRKELLERSFPRLQMLLLVSLSGLAGFLVSVSLLHAGLSSMAIRYFVAAIGGYLFFLLLVRLWLAHQRGQWSPHGDVSLEVGGEAGPNGPGFFGEGGEFGGGGASGSYSNALPSGVEPPASLEAASAPSLLKVAPDVDDAAVILLAIAALSAGIVALGIVVYASPILFAEVLLDAAVVSAVYRRARRRSRGHWLHGVMRRTWLPAAVLCISVAIGGFALQLVEPEATSLGGVLSQSP